MSVLVKIVLLLFLPTVVKCEVGTFWHVTDMHHDIYYDESKPANEICPSSSGAETINAGIFGDYRCDSPWQLILSAVNEMKAIQPDPNFIIWTGDDVMHTFDEEKYLGEEVVFDIIKKQSELLRDTFPDTVIYPSLGNHDMHLKNQFPVDFRSNSLLQRISQLWCDLYFADDPFACEQFSQGGYFKTELAGNPQAVMISLNSPLWYGSNKLVTGEGDPNDQFAWLENELQVAQDHNKKVYIMGHIPPGYFELVDYKYWLYERYNKEYLRIISTYSEVILGQFFAHHHTDTFRLVLDKNTGEPVSSIWLAPGITPWMTTLPGVVNGANNPGIRLFEYDQTTAQPLDYIQYYVDLNKANNDRAAEWVEEYRFTEAFAVPDLSTKSFADLTCNLAADDELFQKFAFLNSVSYNAETCNATCKLNHLCAVAYVDYLLYEDCVRSTSFAETHLCSNANINNQSAFLVLLVLMFLSFLL